MTTAELEAALRAVEPAARLVPERRLLRLLVYLRDHGRAVPLNPDLPVWVSRDDLRDADVLPVEDDPRLLLLTTPDDRLLDGMARPELLRAYWRLLFQVRLADAVRGVGEKAVPAVVDALGPAAVREVRYVLEADHRIDPRADAVDCTAAFAAAFLDLSVFDPAAVDEFFPSVPPETARRLLGELVGLPGALYGCRPVGAAGPGADAAPAAPAEPFRIDPTPAAGTDALQAEARGNYVRSAISHAQAAAAGRRKDRDRETKAARDHLGLLVHRLADVLGWSRAEARKWKDALAPLLGPAAVGRWPRAARGLYELQKITADLSGDVFAVDLVEYLRTLGRRPVVRPLPRARDVRLLTRLRAAAGQIDRAGLQHRDADTLARLFHAEMHRVEHRVRGDLTPVVTAALEDSGFRPANRVDEVARDKAVAELLDRVCDRGFLRLGDLRDAVARNRLKMPDLAGPGEFFAGDPLLRADVRLSYDLDGVYRRGEAYLRWLQRGSSVFFGTAVGRALTLYLIGPFLAAFLLLMTAEEFRHLGGKAVAFAAKILAPRPAPPEEPTWWLDDDGWPTVDPNEASQLVVGAATSSAAEHHGDGLVTVPAVVALGLFFLLVFHAPPFRRAVVAGFAAVGRWLRRLFWDAPRAVWRSSVVRAVWYSRAARFAGRWLGVPVVVTGAVVLVLWLLGASPGRLVRWGGMVFAAGLVVLNSPWGRVVQDRLAERLSDMWRLVRVNLLPGLIGAIVDGFARLANWVEQRLYAVDEWFRYRPGQSGGSVVLKAVLGLVWYPFAYLARFAFYLLIEPQINPVKHFPVVTVSHKVILPMAPSLAEAVSISEAEAVFALGCVPGVFGFIAWELMANWRLYAANRPPRLAPVTVGSHGETVRGLLRPGFHSGTVPRLFAKLRAASRRGDRATAGRLHHDLDHVAEGVRRFVERELVGLLRNRPGWAKSGLAVAGVRFGCLRMAAEVTAPGLGPVAVALSFENRCDRISAEVEQFGWLDDLNPDCRVEFLAAVRGLFDMAGAGAVGDRDRCPGDGPDANGILHPFGWAEWVTTWDPVPAGPVAEVPSPSTISVRPHDPHR